MKDPYEVPFRNRLARFLIRPIFRGLFYMLGRVCITGIENMPSNRAYMIAINHISIFEAPFIVAFWPVVPEAVGAVEIWQRPGQSILARLYGGIQLHRGEYDRHVLDAMLAALRAGKPLLIAPEGGRSHKPGMRRALPGVAYIVEKAQVPVVPVGIVGTTEDYFKRAMRRERPLLEMHIGKPLCLPGITGNPEERRETRQRNADLIMAHVATLLPVEYRGVYADHPIVTGETNRGGISS
jgi:1-acyl-sn-glycerol-3-phosphate acyltransferase